MAILWGLPNWVWAVIGLIALAACAIILRVLRLAFQSLQQLAESVSLSAQMLKDAISDTQREISKIQAVRAVATADAAGRPDVPPDSWRDW